MAASESQFVVVNEFDVVNDDVKITDDGFMETNYGYQINRCVVKDGKAKVVPQTQNFVFRTDTTVPKMGVMIVGLAGNNGSTLYGSIIANRENICWETKEGKQTPNFYGSITQATTTKIGTSSSGQQIYVPLKSLVPLVNPCDIVVGGWDINGYNMADAMKRAKVFPIDLQNKLAKHMSDVKCLPGIYYPDFIASNQSDRADNALKGNKACWEHVEKIRSDIKTFKDENKLDKVIVLWSANTERYADIIPGVNTTADDLLKNIKDGHSEIAPSTIYAVAAALEKCSYINGSPQNTFVPGYIEFAKKCGIFIGGDDFKSGQTKIKSVLVDFMVNAGIKVESIVSYNHLGNNDGKNLNEAKQFRSKEISKAGVVDDMVASNTLLYPTDKGDAHPGPDHCVVIKYVKFVGDSKRAMDEYTSRIFMNGLNTIVMHNTCEDSLLATPLIIDLVVLTELMQRIKYQMPDQKMEGWAQFDSVLSILSYMLKAPQVEKKAPVINALAAQRTCIENVLKCLVGIHPENHMLLEYKTSMNF